MAGFDDRAMRDLQEWRQRLYEMRHRPEESRYGQRMDDNMARYLRDGRNRIAPVRGQLEGSGK